MEEIKVTVKATTGTGKSHVLAVIERALIAEYGPLMKVECKELNSERNLIGSNLESWNKPNPTQVYINLVEENVPPTRVADLSKSRPPIGALMDRPSIEGDEPMLSTLLIDCIDPSLAGALRAVMETHSIVAMEHNLAKNWESGRGVVMLVVNFDAELVKPVANLFTRLKELQNQDAHGFREYANTFLISSNEGVFQRAMVLSLHGVSLPTIVDGKGFVKLTGLVNSPSHVDVIAQEAWANRNLSMLQTGHIEQIADVMSRGEFVPSIKCPPFS